MKRIIGVKCSKVLVLSWRGVKVYISKFDRLKINVGLFRVATK